MNIEANINSERSCMLLFEYPLKEHIRGFLRLETLFCQFERNRLATHADSHLHALKLFIEILEILERGDTRSELIKELARLSEKFTLLKENPSVDSGKLDNFLNQIEQLHQWVLKYQGKFGEKIRKSPFMDSIKHRLSIPGGACSFDCPDLYLFLNSPHRDRQLKLKTWLNDIKAVKTSIEVILRIIRDSGQWVDKQALLGSFMIDTAENPAQLLRIKINESSGMFPEFSCGKHRSSIHFMQFDDLHKKIPLRDDIDFKLACCN